MKLALIGFGQAGGKVADAFVEYEQRTGEDIFTEPIAVNTATVDLSGLQAVPEANRVLIGQSRVKGHGVGADNELGAEIAAADLDEIQGAIDEIPVHDVDAFLIVAGLGGGTGSGGAPVLAEHLSQVYTEPVFGLGILPAADEGGIYTLNAARSFKTFVREVDNLLLFDNDAWRSTGESVRGGFEAINREIATRFGMLFGAGEVGPGGHVAETVVDSSEIINTLQGGGVSTVGYASERVETATDNGLLSRFRNGEDETDDFEATTATNRIAALVRKAALGRLTLPCDVDGAERALVVVGGPPEQLDRKGMERGRRWIEEETGSMAVRGGDYPIPTAEHVASAVLLSGVHDIPRLERLKQIAVEAEDNRAQRRAERDATLEDLLEPGAEELRSLF